MLWSVQKVFSSKGLLYVDNYIGGNMLKNWKTTLAGFVGGTTGTTVLLALTSPDFNLLLSDAGIEKKYLVVIAGISKIIRDIYTRDVKKMGRITT